MGLMDLPTEIFAMVVASAIPYDWNPINEFGHYSEVDDEPLPGCLELRLVCCKSYSTIP